MKRILLTLVVLFSSLPANAASLCEVQPHFTPTERIAPIIAQEIRNAKYSVHVASYGISNPLVTEALIERHRAHIETILIEDKLQSAGKSSLISVLRGAGVPVIIKPSSTLMHNKYIIIDGYKVIMGSWNLSVSAEKQDNSIVVIRNCETVNSFEADFKRMRTRYGQN